MAEASGSSRGALALAVAGASLLLVPLLLLAPGTVAAAAAAPPPGLEFRVGGPRGWRVPDANTSYGWWAMHNRFHVGDRLYFKYANDSVLLVDRPAFDACNATAPLAAFVDGSTTFLLGRPGFFCFISGAPGHCQEGQRLIVRVMVHPAVAASPATAPAAASTPAGSAQPGHGWPRASSGAAPAVAAAAGVAAATVAMAVLVGLVLMLQ